MWWLALMMFTSPVFPFIVFVCMGLTDVAHSYDALPLIRKSREVAKEHLNTSANGFPGYRLGIVALTQAPTIAARKPINVAAPATTTIQPPTTEPNTSFLSDSIYIAAFDGRKLNSVDMKASQMSDNKAERPGVVPDLSTTSEHSQELVCNCSGEGVSDPDECDRETGQCDCMPGNTGLQCEECEEDHFTNGTIGCLPCGCDSFGAVSSRCDSSGTCDCKTGVYGPKCDDCHPGFFHFSSTGCQPCQCNSHSTYCHPQSGVCLDCQGNTQAHNCEECLPSFYRRHGDGLGDACTPCPCSSDSSSGSCHLDSSGDPVCDKCKPGFSGPTCDVCTDGFFKSAGACVPCDCNGNSDPRSIPQICHPESGRCHRCINNTAGEHCEICAHGYVGVARSHNCTLRAVRLLPTREDIQAEIPKSRNSVSSTPPLLTSSFATTTRPSLPTLQSGAGDSAGHNSTASALTVVSWTQFNIIILAVIIVVVVLLMGFVGGVYTYREYRNRKLNAPFWTIELKEDNISFSSYHDSIPHADPNGLLEEEPCVVAANGQLALATAANMYKA
ncbi:multiple epidermal growth factor-like domains protein 9 [Triplophysa rosa]|uniref:Multiple epidermal growth factor-like domains protein 9 n=1 Tax=Triplophysa rosa TaxID=992332 RepID=A0A9W7TFJ7_TRIRA|nr:multiple epidermal growth factor-like domains protein 9 [Triplophysa rosa]KAI7797743.1 putative multiple epidermal growth factor-like domains protein 9 [Triplophysa rosa]